MVSPAARQNSAGRDLLWKTVGKWQVAPKYFGSVPLRSRSFRGQIEVFEWIPGRVLSPARDAVAVAATLARLHSRPVSAVSQCLPPTPAVPFVRAELRRYSRLNRAGGSIEEILAREITQALRTLSKLRSLKARSCLVHNDLVDGNVLSSQGRIWLIDWDWALISAPCIDLFCFLSPFVRSWGSKPLCLSSRTASNFLSAYLSGTRGSVRVRSLGAQADLWHPYNVLLANWLYHDAKRLPHTGRSDFYTTTFEQVSRLAQVIDSFK